MLLARESDLDWWLDFYLDKSWRFARSMSSTPHSYLVRFKTISDEDWSHWYGTLVNFGLPGKFNGRPNIYLHGPEREEDGRVLYPRWWTMEMRDHAENLILNYATDGKTYGDQDVPALTASSWSPFNAVAPWWDKLYVQTDRADRIGMWKVVESVLQGRTGTFLDIGAGTGGSLEARLCRAELTTALDPSTGMMNCLWEKFPRLKGYVPASMQEFADWETGQIFDYSIASFGAASYLSDEEIEAAARMTRNFLFLSFSNRPAVTEALEPVIHRTEKKLAQFGRVYDEGNYSVVVLKGLAGV
jgi:hypothetical protein